MTDCKCKSCTNHVFVPEYYKKTEKGLYCNECGHLVQEMDSVSGYFEFELPMTINLAKLYATLDMKVQYKLIDQMIKDTGYTNALFNKGDDMKKLRQYTIKVEESLLSDLIFGTIKVEELVEYAMRELEGEMFDEFLEWIINLNTEYYGNLCKTYPDQYKMEDQ